MASLCINIYIYIYISDIERNPNYSRTDEEDRRASTTCFEIRGLAYENQLGEDCPA